MSMCDLATALAEARCSTTPGEADLAVAAALVRVALERSEPAYIKRMCEALI
jgi:hypothetical protein